MNECRVSTRNKFGFVFNCIFAFESMIVFLDYNIKCLIRASVDDSHFACCLTAPGTGR